jgi:hypothetical protein
MNNSLLIFYLIPIFSLPTLISKGYILNWSGEVSPVVHQLDHYLDELEALAEVYQKKTQVMRRDDIIVYIVLHILVLPI